MKISELSELSQISSETIRTYRNRKMLRPEQDSQNGYYSYSMEDFLNVLYIRKLRGSNLSLGTIYEAILSTHHMPIPENAVVFPKGMYVTTHVALDDLNFIDREQLRPMMDYIREHHYIVDSDTTAFLFRIDHSGPRPKRIYRLRVKVVKASGDMAP